MKIRTVVADSCFIFSIFSVLLCLALFADLSQLFAYRRANIIEGEYWRLLSGHFTHTSLNHLYLNFAAWVLIWVYGRSILNVATWSISFILCAVISSFGFLILLPNLSYYEGLSGILHGLLVIAVILRIQATVADFTAWAVLFFITVKLFYEGIYGPSELTQSMIDLPILTEAHLYGVISGLLIAAGLWTGRAVKGRSPTNVRAPG